MLCNWLTRLSLKQKLWVRVPLSQHTNAPVVQRIRIRHYGCHDEGSIPSRGTKFITRHSQVQGTHHSLYGYQFP